MESVVEWLEGPVRVWHLLLVVGFFWVLVYVVNWNINSVARAVWRLIEKFEPRDY
jgi:hypothetical protein